MESFLGRFLEYLIIKNLKLNQWNSVEFILSDIEKIFLCNV